jgi:hypothetical protein
MKHTPFIYYKYLFLWACLFGTLSASAQNQIAGTVYELSEQQELLPVVGANVRWANTNIGTITDLNGQFTLPRTNQTLPWWLVLWAIKTTPYHPNKCLNNWQLR